MSESNTPNYVTELQFGQTVYTLEDENAVRYNQGSANAGKVLGVDDDGSVIPVDFEGDDFEGATASEAGTHGYVPAPAAGDQGKFLKGDGTWGVVDQADFTGATASAAGAHGMVPAPTAGQQGYVLMGNGSWQLPPNCRLDTATLNVVNQEGSYTGTVYHDAVTTHSQAIMLEIGTPEVFRDKITVTPGAGYFTVTCDDVVGSTTLKISFMRQVQTSEEITSAEFDILDNRISAIENPYTETNVTIAHTSWELVSGLYTYVWESSLVTPTCGYEVGLRDGAESAGIDDFDYEKVTGGIKFTTSQQPTGSLPVTIKLYGAKATSRDELPGCVDLPITIPANGWSNSAPYTYTYLSEYITENSAVNVDFSSANENTEISYLDSEMTSEGNGVNIIAPSKPTTAVAVVVHVDNSINANITGVNASQVATNAISGAANVQEALTGINSNITTLSTRTNGTLTLKSGSATGSIKYEKVGQFGILTIDVVPSGSSGAYEIVEPQSVVKPIQTTYSTLLDAGCYFYANGSVGIYNPVNGKNYVGEIVFITTL